MNLRNTICTLGPLVTMLAATSQASQWTVGTPIVTYWAGPAMTDATATQMAEGGFNVVWCREKELDVAQRHGLRAQLQDRLLLPSSLDNPAQLAKLEALIERVKKHPALYSYFITDEPNAKQFAALGKLVAWLRERDPEHMAYINLFPTYATNQQLGNQGEPVTAYQAHLREFIGTVKPALVSYDHYQFSVNGDNPDYFLNLALIRRAAQDANLPFLNIVQACTWTPAMRVPTSNEMRYLVYTTAAYGAQGISYYVYCHPGHTGGLALSNGTPTPIYHALKNFNREFVAIARELQPLRSLGVYHAGMLPPGGEALPKGAGFTFEPPIAEMQFVRQKPVKGLLLGLFGKTGKPTHAVLVNLDYTAETTTGIRGPEELEILDAATGEWSSVKGARAELQLAPGGGKLLRVRR